MKLIPKILILSGIGLTGVVAGVTIAEINARKAAEQESTPEPAKIEMDPKLIQS